MNMRRFASTILLLAVAAAGIAPASDASSPSPGGADLAARVRQALHADPALFDKHINVTMEDGKVVLRGFVTSAEDLQKALRTADVTAGKDHVINKLTIKEGGDGGSG
jgi:osmotically-inducible protein OsmY